MRKGIPIPLSHELVEFARGFAGKWKDEIQELAALAGSLYFMGGRATYYLGRGMFGAMMDVPDSNMGFRGIRIEKKAELWETELVIEADERRRGWLWHAVAVSPVVNKGTEEEPKFQASALVLGYWYDDLGEEGASPGRIKIPVLQTSPPLPVRWKEINGKSVDWPEPFSVTKRARPWGYQTT